MNKAMAAVILIGLLLISPILIFASIVGELGKYIDDVYDDYDGWYWGGRE